MSKKNGFTVTELIVVVTVIAALITILVPALGFARDIAFKTFCKNNLKQLGICVQSYAMENKVYPVCVGDVNLSWQEYFANEAIAKKYLLGVPISLYPYHKEVKLYDCPKLSRNYAKISYCYDSRAGRQYDTGETVYGTSTSSMKTMNYPGGGGTKPKYEYYLLSPDMVKKPERFVILYDLPYIKNPRQNAANIYNSMDPDDYGSYKDEAADSNGYLWNYNGSACIGPHRAGYNILFADLSAEWFRVIEKNRITRKPD
jgi:prepilin-type N-terminal cleavage/methylation domain-containing protein